jgi:tripartite-type tricarboxylate transporter receptor subunit TctC
MQSHERLMALARRRLGAAKRVFIPPMRQAGALRLRRILSTMIACAGTILLAIATSPAQPAAGYPRKPVHVLVPYGPGGVADLTMRLLGEKLGNSLKQQFVIENRPGAGGIVAMRDLLRSPADGYTLGEMGNGQTISASLFNKLPYDVLKDFTPISVAGSFEVMLAVADASAYRTLNDVVDAARKSPGKLNLGAINPGSTQNLSAHLFQQIAGVDFTIITYRTTPDLLTALLRGDVTLGFDYYAALQGVIAPGKLRIIATSGEHRNPLLNNVPTGKESGFPNYIVNSWNGLAGPAGLPMDLVKLVNMEISRALAAPDFQQKANSLGIDATGSTPDEMHARMAQDIVKWREVIDRAGIPKQ